MKLKLFILVSLFFYSCDEETDPNPFVSENENLNNYYFVNLDWDDNSSMNKTSVSIKWNQWISNDSTQFIKYSIKDVTTENVKLIEDINNISDTSTAVEFPAATFLRLCVVAKYEYNEPPNSDYGYKSSDSILFFTQPLSSVTNLKVNPDPIGNLRTITWNPSTDNDIDNLIIYRARTDSIDYIPSLEIDPSDGLPNDNWSILC